jgi:hypothetical protein
MKLLINFFKNPELMIQKIKKLIITKKLSNFYKMK